MQNLKKMKLLRLEAKRNDVIRNARII
jgi:hypothetical protein